MSPKTPKYQYNLSRPTHLIVRKVLEDVEAIAMVKFGPLSRAPIEALIEQYAQKVAKLSYERDLFEARLEKLLNNQEK